MKKEEKAAPFAPREFVVNGNRMSFSPLPLCTLQMVTELTKRLGLDMEGNTLHGIILAAKEKAEMMRTIVALYATKGKATAPNVTRNYILLEKCPPCKLATLLTAGIIANGEWIDLVRAKAAEVDFSAISEEEYFEKPFVELITEKRTCQE